MSHKNIISLITPYFSSEFIIDIFWLCNPPCFKELKHNRSISFKLYKMKYDYQFIDFEHLFFKATVL